MQKMQVWVRLKSSWGGGCKRCGKQEVDGGQGGDAGVLSSEGLVSVWKWWAVMLRSRDGRWLAIHVDNVTPAMVGLRRKEHCDPRLKSPVNWGGKKVELAGRHTVRGSCMVSTSKEEVYHPGVWDGRGVMI